MLQGGRLTRAQKERLLLETAQIRGSRYCQTPWHKSAQP
jgi:alkylhydroperoxidase family enzyme